MKGRGYPPAEKDPAHFHGVGSFEISTGSPAKPILKKPPTYTEVFGDAMVDLGEKTLGYLPLRQPCLKAPASTGLPKGFRSAS